MVILSGHTLDPESVDAIAHGAPVGLAGEARQAMASSVQGWEGGDVLGATLAKISGGGVADWSSFVLGHCAGVGDALPTSHVRALMACRANVLALGFSGCRPEAAQLLLAMLNAGVHPVVPSQGSVGAAGDLAPLAHVASVALRLAGTAERGGVILPAAEAMEGLPHFEPTPKETLSLINGATLVAAQGALAVHRARRLLRTAETALAMSMAVVLADTTCLSDEVLALRGHATALASARRVRAMLEGSRLAHCGRRADAFSIRCAPAVLGAGWSALEHAEEVVGLELNGACDNPLLIDGQLLDGGNFHGAPVAMVLDYLKIALTQAASIAERRIFRLTYGQLTGNLPSFLLESSGVNNGFMLAQYTAASLVSECKGLSHPASVDSIPTGQHHEDHVSMGPTAARTLGMVLDAVEQVLAIEVLVAAQGLDFRAEEHALCAPVARLHGLVRSVVPRWVEDRVLHRDLEAVARLVQQGVFA